MRPYKVFIFLALTAGAVAALALSIPSLLPWPGSHPPVAELLPAEPDSLVLAPVSHDAPCLTQINTDSSQITLKQFREKLTSDLPGVRIMVFGDSQLEGDRLTSYIRSALRQHYGGTGPGLLQPLMPVMYTRTVEVRSSSNWARYNYLSYRNGHLPHKKLGPFMAVCRFFPPDSISSSTITASVRITPSIFSDPTSVQYDRFRLFYGDLPGHCHITISSANSVIASDTLQRGEGPFEFSSNTFGLSDLRISLSGNSSPDI